MLLSTCMKCLKYLIASSLMLVLVMINVEVANDGPKEAVSVLGMEVLVSTNIANAFMPGGNADCDDMSGCTGPDCEEPATVFDVSTCTLTCESGSMIVCTTDSDPGEG